MARASRTTVAHARAFFTQARHDLEDAEILFRLERWPGTVRDAQAAAEKVIKAALYLRVGVAQATTTISMFGHYVSRWIASDRVMSMRVGKRLQRRIDALEQQVPKKIGTNKNPEYPFAPPPGLAPPDPPASVYRRHDAEEALETARRMVSRIASLYPSL